MVSNLATSFDPTFASDQEALQHATAELMGWLMKSYGFDERSASRLLGQRMAYEISNVGDPAFTTVTKLRNRYLGPPH